MQKYITKALALMLVIAMVLSGCNQSNGSSSTASADENQDSTSTSENSSVASAADVSPEGSGSFAASGVGDTKYGAGELKKWDEPITVTFGKVLDENGEGVLAMEAAGEPLEDNRWTRYYKEELNVIAKYEMVIANSVDYNQKLLLAMSSGTLPDVFQVNDLSVLKQLAESGAIADLTTIYKENVNTTYRDIMEYEGTEIYNPVTFDGKLYAIPVKMPSTNGYNHCWVRQDWLDELKLDRPETMQDVHDIAKAFVENYDNNIGLMLNEEYISESKGIFWAYGGTTAVRKYWQEMDDGTVAFSEVQPEMKGGLQWLRDMYSEGLVNKEFATEDIAKAFEYVASNQCGIFFGPHWYGFRLQSAEASMDDTADWVAVGLPTGIEGKKTEVYATNTFDGVYCVNAKSENPEALVQVLNAYVEKLFGEDNDFDNFFACPENNGCWSTSPVHSLHPLVDLTPHQQMKDALENDTADQLTGSGKSYWEYIDQGLSAYKYMFGPVDSCFNFVDDTYPDIVNWNAYYGAPTATWADRWSSMQELIDTTYLKIIQGQIELDEGFDKMVEEWNSIGGEAVTKEVNDIYSTY